MSPEWLSPPLLVAGAAALVSTVAAGASWWAAWTSHRMLKRQRAEDYPSISCEWRSGGEWMGMLIIAENPTSTTWQAKELRIKSPRDAVAVERDKAFKPYDPVYGSSDFSHEAAAQAAGRVTHPHLKVTARGSAAPPWAEGSRGDLASAIVYIRRGRRGSRPIKVVLTMESLEPNPRMKRYLITRTPPPLELES